MAVATKQEWRFARRECKNPETTTHAVRIESVESVVAAQTTAIAPGIADSSRKSYGQEHADH